MQSGRPQVDRLPRLLWVNCTSCWADGLASPCTCTNQSFCFFLVHHTCHCVERPFPMQVWWRNPDIFRHFLAAQTIAFPAPRPYYVLQYRKEDLLICLRVLWLKRSRRHGGNRSRRKRELSPVLELQNKVS